MHKPRIQNLIYPGAQELYDYKADNPTVNPIKLETGLRPNSAGIPHTVLLRIEAIGFPTFGLLLWVVRLKVLAVQDLGVRVEGLGGLGFTVCPVPGAFGFPSQNLGS